MYFDRPGRENTGQVAVLALNRAKELGIQYIVVASNTGYTADFFAGKGIKAVCVTHHIGFREPGSDEMSAETRENLKSQGVELLTTTHLFGNVERAVTTKFEAFTPVG